MLVKQALSSQKEKNLAAYLEQIYTDGTLDGPELEQKLDASMSKIKKLAEGPSKDEALNFVINKLHTQLTKSDSPQTTLKLLCNTLLYKMKISATADDRQATETSLLATLYRHAKTVRSDPSSDILAKIEAVFTPEAKQTLSYMMCKDKL